MQARTIRTLTTQAHPLRKALLQDEIRGFSGGPIVPPPEPPSHWVDYRFDSGGMAPKTYAAPAPSYAPPVSAPSYTAPAPSYAPPVSAPSYSPPTSAPTYAAPPSAPDPLLSTTASLAADVSALKSSISSLLTAPRTPAADPDLLRTIQAKLNALEARQTVSRRPTVPPRPQYAASIPPTEEPTYYSPSFVERKGAKGEWVLPVGLGVALFAVGVGEEVGRARRAREAAERRAREEERGKAKEVVGKGGGRRWFGLVG